jgi:hypothetical protein
MVEKLWLLKKTDNYLITSTLRYQIM